VVVPFHSRGSIFRLLVGAALLHSDPSLHSETWGRGNSSSVEIRRAELSIETLVSRHIGSMSLLWLNVNDEPGPRSLRSHIERNAIALLSNIKKAPLDPSSEDWLGHHCPREKIKKSDLWNSNHVDEKYDSDFLDLFDRFVSATSAE
jgi:hypothetical protein